MAGLGEIALDEVVHFDVVTHNVSTGAVSDADSTPTFSVFEEDTDTPIVSASNFTKRTALTGNYRGTFTASTANGFEVGKWYNIVASATVNSVAAKAIVQTFRVIPAESSAGVQKVDVTHISGSSVSTSSAQLGVNVVNFGGSAGTFSSGRPEVNTTHAAGTAWGSGAITASSFAAGAITASVIATDAIDADALAADAIAEINATVDTALADIRLDELLAADSDIDGAAPPTVGSVFHELMTKTTGSFTYDQTTDSLEAVRDRGDAAWITATGFSTHSAADVWSSGTRTLTGIDEDTTTLDLDATIRAAVGMASANMDTQLGTLATSSALTTVSTNVSTAVTQTTAASIRTSVGLASANLDTQLDALPTANENADAVLGRGVSNIQDTADTTSLCTVVLAMLESSISGTTWTIRKTGGTTFVTKTLTTTATADAVTGVT